MTYINEITEMWKHHKEQNKLKKMNNTNSSISILENKGILLTKYSDIHYKVSDYDFWPSTGKFWNKKTNKKGRGVFNLLKLLDLN